ncbi:MAG: HAMP domain-containing histidine kinase [Bacilli bacterium]|nr:HAMP domain-containing histidine kinase [Bacilli bacterium]
MRKSNKFSRKMMFQLASVAISSLLITFIFMISILALIVMLNDWEVEVPEQRPIHLFLTPYLTIMLVTIVSLAIGVAMSLYLGKKFIKPISDLKVATEKVAKGDFNVIVEDIPESETGELIENFNVMVKELQKNEILKNDFISNVSHEFKTPLSTIQGYATLLQDESLNEEDKQKYTQIIIESTTKLTALVNNILKISKIDNRKITIETNVYQLDEQIRESILSLENMWSNKNIDFDINLESIEIVSDENLLSNVWNNLLSNAIKFSDNNGKISINLTKDDNNAIVSIKDYGCGIKEEDIPYIFDKFYQTEKSHNIEGNGLGLALVKKIVTLLNGSVTVNSNINEGSEFIVTLPL